MLVCAICNCMVVCLFQLEWIYSQKQTRKTTTTTTPRLLLCVSIAAATQQHYNFTMIRFLPFPITSHAIRISFLRVSLRIWPVYECFVGDTDTMPNVLICRFSNSIAWKTDSISNTHTHTNGQRKEQTHLIHGLMVVVVIYVSKSMTSNHYRACSSLTSHLYIVCIVCCNHFIL